MSHDLRPEHVTYLRSIPEAVGREMFGLGDVTRLLLVALVTGGHVLLEGNPGLGKTALVRALAKATGLGPEAVGRIQFTPDLMPSDITGTLMPVEGGQLEFRKGPIFHQLVIADEINRATPKTQAAMLEAMAEGQVTVLGTTRPLREARSVRIDGRLDRAATPFMVMATQNPIDQDGTYDLPEAQSDRFMVKVRMPAPSAETVSRILRKEVQPLPLPDPRAREEGETAADLRARDDGLASLAAASRAVLSLNLPPAVEAHVVNLIQATNGRIGDLRGLSPRRREALAEHVRGRIVFPLGPRAAAALAKGALGWAAVAGTAPEEAQGAAAGARDGLAAVMLPTLRHRLRVDLPDSAPGSAEADAQDAFLSELARRAAPDQPVAEAEGAGYHERFAAAIEARAAHGLL